MNAVGLLSIILSILITSVFLSERSFGSTNDYFSIQPPMVLLREGGLLNEYSLRHHDLSVGISLKSLTKEYRDYVIITEIRKLPEGTTSFISTVPEKTDIDEEEYIRIPWVPNESGTFQVRVFLISNSEHPQVLASVQTSETTIYDDSFKGLVKLSRSACDGACPTYQIEVFQNRTVVFVGHENVVQLGRHSFEASQDQIDKIIDAINESNFFSAEFEFTGAWAEGLQVTALEVKLDDKWRQVHYPSEADIPDELAKLEMVVEEVIVLKN